MSKTRKGEISFNRIRINNILDGIKIQESRNYSTNTFISNPSSNSIEYLSTEGKTISFKSIVPVDRPRLLKYYRNLACKFKNKSAVLAGKGDLNEYIRGNYFLVNYSEEKNINGSYVIEWEFLEHIRPNKVARTFKRIGKSVTKKTTSTKNKNVIPKRTSNYITILLRDCRTLKYGTTNSKCVKYLQKFLQKKGYYKGYKVDGDYLQYTKQAVTQLQKAYRLKATGVWDTNTRNYWRKKYNITSKKKK